LFGNLIENGLKINLITLACDCC